MPLTSSFYLQGAVAIKKKMKTKNQSFLPWPLAIGELVFFAPLSFFQKKAGNLSLLPLSPFFLP